MKPLMHRKIRSCIFFMLCLYLIVDAVSSKLQYDKYGYVLYCPCMGRLGNQVDHLLGSFAFAKKLNRTLVVPPWIGHNFTLHYKNSFSSYSNWFQFNSLKIYHKAILMEDFMKDLAPHIWPPAQRRIYCYSAAFKRSKDKASCPAKEGNPFGPFWDNFNVDFVSSSAFPSGLYYESDKQHWDQTFPPAKHLVLAFIGAPAAYPVSKKNRHIQKYIEWSSEVATKSQQFIDNNIKFPFIGIHLRNGIDWVRACEHVGNGLNYPFMSSPQCVGYGNKAKVFTMEMCLPKKETVITQTLEQLKKYGAKTLFIATDNQSYEDDFKAALGKASMFVDIVRIGENRIELDLALLIEADAFIGSCGSSVSAFASRKRATLNKPNLYFGCFADDQKTEL